MPTFWEVFVLALLVSIILSFFIGKKILPIWGGIFILIIIGFFLGIGIHIFNLLVQ